MPRRDWYVWADARPDGTPPNNWLSIFGGSAWQWDTRRLQYYLHNFLAEQPDLNFHNQEVQDALLDVTRFWLERGVDGFRLDTINFYFHSQGLEDNPPLPVEERNDQTAPAVNPYNYQDHLYDKSRPENLSFLERFRALLDEYPAAAAVGEIGDSQRGLEVVAAYTAGESRVQMCYAFDFLAPEKISAAKVRSVLEAFGRVASDGWSCWAFSNHDVVRHASRWAAGEPDRTGYLKVVSALLMSMRGSVCLYQGEELGLGEAELPSRICRTPTASGSGRSSRAATAAARRWCGTMPSRMAASRRPSPGCRFATDHLPLAVNKQQGDPGSLLEHYRRFLAFRRGHPALAKGDIEFLAVEGDALRLPATKATSRIVCAFNLGSTPASIDLGAGKEGQPLSGHGLSGRAEGGTIRLQALRGLVRAASLTAPRTAQEQQNLREQTMADLTLRQIKKAYGSLKILHGIDLDIKSGEFIVFVGPSGCGKSTLLRTIAGLEEITSGELKIAGDVVNDVPPSKRGIAMVFQSYALYPHMTVYDNMAFGMKIARENKAEIDRRCARPPRSCSSTKYLDRLPKALSGGQRQRVAIGRAIVRNPKVFLFDEPLSNLDAALRVATRIEIAKLKESMPDTTMIYVTHDQVEAMTLADRIVVLKDGWIEQVGTPMELYHHPGNLFVAQFIGSPAMNIVPATVEKPGAATVIAVGDRKVNVPVSTPLRCRGNEHQLRRAPGGSARRHGRPCAVRGPRRLCRATRRGSARLSRHRPRGYSAGCQAARPRRS